MEHAHKALRLSPLDDPLNYHPYCALALTNLFAGRFADAVAYAALAIRANPGFSMPYAYLVASHVGLGELEAARARGATTARGRARPSPSTASPGWSCSARR